jgi:hypothetical protein
LGYACIGNRRVFLNELLSSTWIPSLQLLIGRSIRNTKTLGVPLCSGPCLSDCLPEIAPMVRIAFPCCI